MTVVGEAIVLVRPVSAGFAEKVLADSDKAMIAAGQRAGASFGKSLTSAIPGANGLQKGIVGIAAAATAAAVASIHMANQFNQNLLLLHTQAGASTAEVNNMRGAIEKLAPEVATGPAKLAEALYHIESTGIRGAAALDDLKIAAQGAKIGQADLDSTTYALTSTLMTGIHGITGAKDAMAALDAIIGTGDMHMQDLNGAISTGFLATAETFGVSLQSIGAALSYMTDRGSSAQESATRLRMSLALMAAPSNQASKMLTAIGLGGAEVTARTGAMTQALQDAHLTTTNLSDDLRKPDGLEVALSDLVGHLRQSGLSADAASALISRAFGGGRSGAAIMSLVQHLDVLKGKYDEQIKIAGNYDERWAATVNSTSFRWSQFITLVQTDAIKAGEALIPMTNAIGSGLFNALSGAPNLLRPLGQGLGEVGHEIGYVLREAEPIGHTLLLAFGGAAYAAVRGAAFVLRDVVAPALHLVGDGLHLLTGTTPGVILLSTVLAYRLLPVVVNLVREFAAWALEKLVVGFYEVTVAAEGMGTALATVDPIVAAIAVTIGAGIGIYEHYANAKKKVAEQTDALVTALQHEAAGQQNSIITALDKQLNDSHVGDNIQRLGLNITDVALAINGSQSSYDKIIGQMRELTHSSSLSGGQLKRNRADVIGLLGVIDTLTGRMGSADKAYTNLEMNQRVASSAIAAAKPPVDALTGAQQALTIANSDLAKANAAVDVSAKTYADDLAKQFPIFDAYVAKLSLNGTTLLKNIEQTTKAIVQEGSNVEELAKRGLSGDVIKQLVSKGPEYVAAAAQLTTTQLQRLQTDVTGYWTAIGNTSRAAALRDGTAAGQNYINGLASQQAATKRVAQITFFNSVHDAITRIVSIAGAQGGNVGGRFGNGLTESKQQVLTAALNALPAPVRAAVEQALGIATTAGGKLPNSMAAAINQHAPAVTGATEAMILAVQARIDMLHGKTAEVRVDNLASGALSSVNSNLQQLEGLNNILKQMRYNAAGNLYEAHDAQIAPAGAWRVWAEPETGGEAYIPLASSKRSRSLDIWAETGQRLGVFADGGIVDTYPLLMGRYLQSLAAGTNPAAFMPPAGTSGSVASWAPTIMQALRIVGAPLSWLPLEERIMQMESGGSTTVINPIADAAGHAIGLMQMKLGTFMAHALPGMTNIFSGLDQLVSSLRYQIAEYGGPANIPGVVSGGYGGYDAGGPVRPGRTLVINNTGGDEFIENGPQHQARTQRGGRPPLEQTNHFYGVSLDEALAQAGARMMHAVNTYMR